MSSSSSKEIVFHFDSITLNNTNKNIESTRVAFDKKFVYIGNANYTIKFKDLNRVNVEECDNNNNGGGYGSRFNRQQQQNRRGGGASTMVMTLQSRDKSFTCLTNNNNNNNAHEFNDFVEKMKVVHTKIKIKNHEKDPYANNSSNTATNAAGGGNNNKRRGGGMNNNNFARPTITPSFPRSQQQQQQQQQSSGGLHMTPTKMKKTSGAYLSSSSTLNNNNRGGGRYNDTTSRSNHNNGNGDLSRGKGHFLNNNVVNNNDGTTTINNNINNSMTTSSPGAFLPPKSPRNATPTKLRPNNDDDMDDEDGVDEFEFEPKGVASGSGGAGGGSGGRVLFHDDVMIHERTKNKKTFGGKKVNKLGLKISQQMMADRSDDEEQEEQEEEEGMVMDKEDEEEEESQREVKRSVSKKKRLRKMVGVTTRDGESDDDDATPSDDDELFDRNVPKSKKRLRLEDNHVDEGDEIMDEKDSPSPVVVVNKGEKKMSEKKKNHGKTITDEDTSRETSPVTTDNVDNEVKAAEGDGGKGSSSVEKTKSSSSSSSTSAKKGTIQSFFQPRSATQPGSSSSSSTVDTSIKKKAAKDSDDDSSNNVPATPVKRKQPRDEDVPLTPRPPPDSSSSMQALATPIQNQRQSQYWIENNTAPKRKAVSRYSDADSDNYHDFGTDEEEEEDDIYNDEENRSPMMKDDLDEKEEYDYEPTTYQTTYQKRSQPFQIQNQRVKRAYGSRRNFLGTSRISNRNNNDDVRSLYPSQADSALMSRKNIGQRTIGRDLSRRHLGPVRNPYERRPPNIIEEDQEDDKPKIPGIQNLGNTCYLSASLQTLFTLPHFLQNLYKSYEEQLFSSKKEMPLTKSLLEVATIIGVLKDEDVPLINSLEAQSMLANCDAANPSALKKQMDVLTDKFHGYEQRDAHEFLGDLVDFLHDELAECPDDEEKEDTTKNLFQDSDEDDGIESAAPPTAAAVATPILPTDEYFHLKVRVCLECNSCGYSRSKDELYRHLSVDVGEDANEEGWSVERSLEQFFQDEERELKCEKCETGTTATQTMEIISRPKALLLHFKRFIVTQKENAEMVLRKNKVKLPLKESLSISSFFSPEEEKPDGLYHLCGVVHHVGNTAFSGHYTTCAKRKLDEESAENVEEQWVFFDDTVGERRTINYVTGNEINQKNCYMALYELK